MAIVYDSIHAELLPTGGDAYLGYADGKYANIAEIKARFPNSPVYALSVLGIPGDGDGVDTEPGNIDIPGAARYIQAEIARGVDMPIGYCGRDDAVSLVNAVNALGVPRSKWRLLTAHYQAGEHTCGPASCGLGVQADGSQWQSLANYDQSLVSNTFILPSDYPGDPVTPQDIANVTAAVLAAVTPVIPTTAEVTASVLLALRQEFAPGEELAGRVEQAAIAAIAQTVPDGLAGAVTAIEAAVEAVPAAVVKALPVPAANTVSLKGETATITFN